MFKFNIKHLYFFGSNVVVSNIYCANKIKKYQIKLLLPNGKGHDGYLYKNTEFKTDKDTFEEVLDEMGLDNFLFKGTKFTAKKSGAVLFKIEQIDGKTFDKNSSINFGQQYNLYFTDNYIDSTPDSIIKIQHKDNSDYYEYKKQYRLFIDCFKDIPTEDEFKKLIYGLNEDISTDFEYISNIYSDYYIEKFKIGNNTIIDNKKPFSTAEIRKITKDYSGKKIEIILSKFNKYSLTSINLTSDLDKICEKKDLTEVITEINRKISKSKKKLTYGDIQNIITKELNYDGIILNNKLTDNLTYLFNITIKEDPKNHFTEHKKCTIAFISNEFELEKTYNKSIEIIFDDKVNEGTNVKEYIFKTYKLNDTNCEIKNDISSIDDGNSFVKDKTYTIKITKEVAGITKNKEENNVIINIEISSDKPDEFKLKDNVVKNKQIVLKKGSCKIKDLLTNLKDNGYNGIEQDGIIEGIFLLTSPSNNILKSNDNLIAGQYKILLSGQVNSFVEKLVKKPSKKDITLTIVPKDETKYKLNGFSKSISISVSENISYNDFVNEIKNIITDGKFEVYIDNNKVENGNIDINKQIVIKLLDDCNLLSKKQNKDEDEEKNKNEENLVKGNNNTTVDGQETKKNKYMSSKKK